MLYDKIKELCDKKGLSVSKLESEARLSNGTIGRWRNSSPVADNLKAVAEVLGVSMDYLLREE